MKKLFIITGFICVIVSVLFISDKLGIDVIEEVDSSVEGGSIAAISTENVSYEDSIAIERENIVNEDINDSNNVLLLDELELARGIKVQLIYDYENVVLATKDMNIIIESDISESMLNNSNDLFNLEFELYEISGTQNISVSRTIPLMSHIAVTERIFRIDYDNIIELWSTDEVEAKLKWVSYNEIIIECYKDSEPIIIELTDEESHSAKEQFELLEENNVEIDSLFWESIENNLKCQKVGKNWLDIDQDGYDELILSVYYSTTGALTPIIFREKGIMIFKVDDTIELKEVIFERNNEEEKYNEFFIGER